MSVFEHANLNPSFAKFGIINNIYVQQRLTIKLTKLHY